MCGSGTFLIEAALKARKVAPGLRRSFAFQQFRMHSATEWERLRADACGQENHEVFAIHGSDVSSTALKHAEVNLAAAGVADTVALKQLNALDAKPTADLASGCVIRHMGCVWMKRAARGFLPAVG